MDSILAISFFVFLALPISLLLRPIGDSFLLSPLVAFCLGIVAAGLTLAFDVSLLVTYPVVALTLGFVFLGSARCRRQIMSNARTPIDSFDLIFVALLLVFGIGFLVHLPPPLAWDARSIWLFHASWLSHGGTVFSAAQALDSLSFSHPSYPFGGPAAIAIVWLLSGTQESLWLGVRVVAFLALTNTIFATKLLLAPFARKAQTLGLTLLAATITALVFLSVDGNALSGYMDVLLATNLSIAFAAMLTLQNHQNQRLDSHPKELIAIAALAIFASVGIKQEGMFFSLVLIVSFAVVYVRKFPQVALLLVSAVASFAIWKLGIAATGGKSESDASGILSNFPELFDLNSVAWSNFSVIWNGYFKNYFIYPNFIFITSVLALLIEPSLRRSLRVLAFAVIAWIGNWVVTFTPYMLGESRDNLGWWLDTSFNRIVSTQLVFTVIFCGFVLARAFSLNIESKKQSTN